MGRTNKLTQIEIFQVYRWVDSWRDVIHNEAWTLPRVTAEVKTKIDFAITEANVETALRDCGIVLRATLEKEAKKAEEAAKRAEAKAAKVEPVQRLEELVADLTARLALVESGIQGDLDQLRGRVIEAEQAAHAANVNCDRLLSELGIARMETAFTRGLKAVAKQLEKKEGK